jgi:hypothetical protein
MSTSNITDPRLTAAREYFAELRDRQIPHTAHADLQSMATRLRHHLGQVLDVITEIEADPAKGRLAEIRAAFARFNWELDDRQYALEEIQRIAGGDAR